MRSFLLIGIGLFGWAAPLAAQTVVVSLSSPESGTTVAPGTPIHWSIGFTVSPGNNAGLALLTVDLAQAAANPAKIDIPPADNVPAAMTNFSRPAGISNPGETNPATGYVGVQRGASGQKNLRQIGGAQNTFGQARPPGSDVAQSANVVGGVGQGGTVILAGGTFPAPAVNGTYTFQLENAMANVLAAVHVPPQHSPAETAVVNIAVTSITFTVNDGTCEPCDVNCDGHTNGRDIQRFIQSLLPSPPAPCSPCAGDINGSGGVTISDTGPFVSCLLGA